ncbi:hypothetical protein Lal_00022470, partial [Lupinus albus]
EPLKDILRMRHANLFEEEPLLDELMQLAGFSNLSSLRCFNIDPSLITALVERWRPETHTFHLPCGVNVNGRPVTGPTYFDWDEMCGELLGKVPIVEEDMRGCELKLAWLVDNFSQLPPNPTQIQLQQYCRACILYILGGELLPHKSNSRVHLMYLHLLRDLSRVNRYSWGSACLANLYRELCRATKPNAKAMGGWGQTQLIFQGVPRGDLTGYRSRLDHMEVSDFKWLPYQTYINNLSQWHQTDRVRLQFGLVQDIPQEPKNLDAIHRVDKRGNQDANWATKHAHWIEYWSQCRDQVLRGPEIQYPIHTQEYNIWYRINSKLFLSSETQLRDPRQINLQTPTTQTQMYQPMMNQPMTSQLPIQGECLFIMNHRDRVDDLMPQRHSFSTDHNDFFTTLLGTPESANMHLNHIDFNFNQDGAGPSSFMVNDNIFPTGQTNTTEDPPTVEHRGRSRRPRQPPSCGTGGHLGNL